MTIALLDRITHHDRHRSYWEGKMAELTEEEKYRRKAIMLERALAAAEEMDRKDAEKSTEKEETDASSNVVSD